MLLAFAQKRDENYYSERLGIDFIEEHFNILKKDFEGILTQSEVQNFRIIRMLGDFQLHSTAVKIQIPHNLARRNLETDLFEQMQN